MKFYAQKNWKNLWKSLVGFFLLGYLLPITSKGQIVPENCDKFLGNIYSSAQITDFTDYWNQVTPENAGKWGSVESTRDVMNWTSLDAAYALAKDNGFPFRFHVLVWGNQQPSWIASLPEAEQLEEIEEWFAAVAERYPDIDYLEVVNEPINDPPKQTADDIEKNRKDYGGYFGALGGTGTTGWDWVINSFKLAREYFPETKLVLNEYNVTNTSTNAQKYINIINLLKAEDLIDVVGVQGHAFETFYASPAETKKNLNSIAATELPIMITEMDIDGPTDAEQLAEYKEIFPIFWEHPSVIGVTLWGWRPGLWRNTANLVTQNGTERPALVWLKEYLQNNCGTPTGLKESKLQQDIKVYPNPATKGSFTFELSNQLYEEARILDYSGKVIKTIDIRGQHLSHPELELKPGMYLVQFVNEQVTVSKKLLVK